MSQEIKVRVAFSGSLIVRVPDSVPAGRVMPLAEKVALAKILATTKNPDAPEADACDDYQLAFDLSDEVAQQEWDASECGEVSGCWFIC